jgi:hypothetical protein
MKRQSIAAAAPLALLLVLAACGGSGNQAAPAANAAADEANAALPPANGAVATESAAAPAPASAPATGILSAYVGKHPSEKVGDLAFLDQPSVKAAVAAVADAKVRDFVFHYNGPDAPIALKDGRVLAWGCEAHNCGYHNWSVAITPDGRDAQVCFYHDNDKPDGTATWYLPGGRTEKRAGNCPSE